MIIMDAGLTSGAITGSTIQNFIKGTVQQIEAGLPENYKISKDINFDLSVVHSVEGGGKLDFTVVGLGGNVSKEQTQRVSFSISPVNKLDLAQERAELQIAREKENMAKIKANALQNALNRRTDKELDRPETSSTSP